MSVPMERPDEAQVISLPATTPMSMIERAVANGADVAVIEKLMDLAERHDRNIGRRAFDQAIAAAKGEIPAIRKNKTVDFTTQKGRTHYKHEDMAEIARTVDPILSKNGLSYRYRTTQDARTVTVTCILSHKDGYSEETTLSAAADDSGNKNHLQAVGSAVTYLQRYTLKMALGLAASEDDDARRVEDAARIDAEQFVVIQGLMADAEAEEARFLKFIGAETLEEMTVAQFAKAVSALRKKIAQKGGAQ